MPLKHNFRKFFTSVDNTKFRTVSSGSRSVSKGLSSSLFFDLLPILLSVGLSKLFSLVEPSLIFTSLPPSSDCTSTAAVSATLTMS